MPSVTTHPPAGSTARCAARGRARPVAAAGVGSWPRPPLNVIGLRIEPTARSPSPVVTTGSSPRRPASSTPSRIELIGPHGTPARLSAMNRSSADHCRSRSTSSGCSSSRWSVRSALRRKRGSSASSSTPSTPQSARNWRSLAAAITTSRSPVGIVWYGYTLGWALPMRCGTTPAAVKAPVWFTRPDSADASRLTSTCWPSPVRSRWWSAASTPIIPCRPVITSNSAMPAR